MQESVENLDPTAEVSKDQIKGRVIKGAAILTGGMFVTQIINLISTALFTIFLEPSQYGVFFLVSAVVDFFTYFSDIGFAASLIQRKEKLTEIELKTVFTTQQVLVFILMIVIIAATPIFKNIYHLNPEAIYLLWALTFSLFLSSLKIIPSVIMERKLEFNKLIIPQLLETILFNLVAVFMAWKGYGIEAFTAAVLIRGIVGLIATYLIQPWKIGFAFSMKDLKTILKFGVPYQLNTLLAMVKDDGMTLFLGGILGTTGIGLLAWAQKWAFAPLRFFMDQIIKVTFPAFSRLQDNKEELSNAVSKSILYICLLVFPALIMLILLAPSLVVIIPKYGKWTPAIFAITILSLNSALAAITTPVTNTLNAIGKISVTFKLMIMWTILTWVFVPFLALKYGVNGAAIGFVLVGLSSVVALIVALKYVKINYLNVVGKPIFISAILFAVIYLIKLFVSVSIFQVSLMLIVGAITYFSSLYILEPSTFQILRKKNV